MTSKVSVVVVNWNGEALLPECLESLASQRYPHLEIIVADNGSTNRSHEVCSRYPVTFLPLGRNLGLAAACNRGPGSPEVTSSFS